MNGKLRNMTSIYLYDESDRLLLLYRMGSKVIKNSYIGTAGGHFEKDELDDARKCVLRELREEVGILENDITNFQMKYITIRLKDNETRQNYYFFAKLIDFSNNIKSNEGKLEWVSYDKIYELDMPHTAKYVIDHYVKEGRYTNKLYTGVAVVNGLNFTELEEFE